MLNDTLLLDSAGPLGKTPNSGYAGPEHCSEGVPLSWYVLRVSYSRELKVQEKLHESGVESFIPMMWRSVNVAGRLEKRLLPAVNNLCFARWTRQEIEDFIKGYGESSPVHFYWDRTSACPMTIPEKSMEDFIKVASSLDEDLIYLTEIYGKLREGQMVKVKDGPLKGVTGRVVRIRKSRRILVELPGMLAVASTYVPSEMLEII